MRGKMSAHINVHVRNHAYTNKSNHMYVCQLSKPDRLRKIAYICTSNILRQNLGIAVLEKQVRV